MARAAPPFTTCLRFATIYGVAERMRFDLTVNEFTRDLWAGRTLEVFGEQFWRPYVHARDAARAIVEVLDGVDPAHPLSPAEDANGRAAVNVAPAPAVPISTVAGKRCSTRHGRGSIRSSRPRRCT